MRDVQRTIFISYRRGDNPDFVERIRDWFIQRYGRDHVFMDFDSIPPFVQFDKYIQDKVRASDVLIAIIGPQWLDLLQQKAARFEEDFVRIEIAAALAEDKLVAPICIKGAAVPPAAALPPELKPMLAYNAAFLNSGIAFLDNIGRIMEAIEQELRRRDPLQMLSAEDYFNRAKARNDNSDEEIADYTEAIRLNPEYTKAYNNRGVARNAQGNLDGAIADYTEALRLNPKLAETYINRGNARYDKKDYDAAIADYTEALRLNPQLAVAYWGLGNCEYEHQRYSEALRHYERYVQLAGSTPGSFVVQRIAELKRKLGRS